MYPSTSADVPHSSSQDPSHRKWTPAAVNTQPEPLKVFLQHRIKSIISKEWWDFVVNVNNMNSDHASLLYSVANLCPSFQNFLRTRDKELNYILQKRPQIKPRIFSGSERVDRPPVNTTQSAASSSQKKSCAAELDQIISELYPNEMSIIKRKPRTFGPISKQKKLQNLKRYQALQAQREAPPEDPNSITLAKLLRDEHPYTTAKTPDSSYPTSSSFNKESKHKVEYTISNYDVNRNKLSLNMKKVKKIIKVKKKILTYTDNNDKSRTKYLLESETPELKRDQIKKYRIKKCSVVLQRLTWKQIKEARSKVKSSQPNKDCIASSTSAVGSTPVPITYRKLNFSKHTTMKVLNVHPDVSPKSPLSNVSNGSMPTISSTPPISSSELKNVICSNDKSNVESNDQKLTRTNTVDSPTSFKANNTVSHFNKEGLPDADVASNSNNTFNPIFDNPTIISIVRKKIEDTMSIVNGLDQDKSESSEASKSEEKQNRTKHETFEPASDGISNSSVKTDILKDKPAITIIKKEMPSKVDPSVSSIDKTATDCDRSSTVFKEEAAKLSLLLLDKSPNNSSPSVPSQPLDKPQLETSMSGSKFAEKEQENTVSASPKIIKNQEDNHTIKLELKTAYCHGGIVPLGKISSSNENVPIDKNKHFLSLKDKKIKDTQSESSDPISSSQENNIKIVTSETKVQSELLNGVPSIEHIKKEFNHKINVAEACKDIKLEMVDNLKKIINPKLNDINSPTDIKTVECVENGACDQIKDFDPSKNNSKEDLEQDSDEKTLVIDESVKPDCEKDSPEEVIEDAYSQDDIILIESPPEVIEVDSEDEDTEPALTPTKVKLERLDDDDMSDTGNNYSEGQKSVTAPSIDDTNENDFDEPSAKRPRVEINLAQVKFDTISCKICSKSFNSHNEWLQHYTNEVPNCAPNLQVSWDRPELSLMN